MPPAHTFALFWSQCLSDSVRGVSWDLTLTNLFLVIVRFAIAREIELIDWKTTPKNGLRRVKRIILIRSASG